MGALYTLLMSFIYALADFKSTSLWQFEARVGFEHNLGRVNG